MNNPIDHAGWAMEEPQFESRLERERFFEFGSSDNERQGAVKKILRSTNTVAHANMRKRNLKTLTAIAVFLMASCAYAQNSDSPAYLNPSLPAEQRAADLVHRMTVEEKVSQLTNQSRAIERLRIPAYNWWSEALHGVASSGTTEFPEPVGLASTFDTDAIHRMAIAISIEARIKRAQFERAGHSRAQEGLDFWAPNINIFRDPRWGRGQETYGEDPFLSARLGVAFVT